MTLLLRMAIMAMVALGVWTFRTPDSEGTDLSPAQDGALPITSKQVHAYTRAAKEAAAKAIEDIIAIPSDQQTFDNTLGQWNRFGYGLIEPLGILTYVKESDMSSSVTAALALQELLSYLEEAITGNPKVFQCLIGYCQKALKEGHPLTPFAYYQIAAVLESALPEDDEDISDADKQTVMSLKRRNADNPKAPFAYWLGNAKDATGHQPLTVMTLNTCGVPGQLTLPNGGMLPWPERLASLAQKVLEADPDIICLNEVYGYDAPAGYYHQLKERYRYFYACIAPRTFGLSMNTLGLSSGLFVASKYPLKDPHFMRYAKRGYPVNDGLFDFIVMDGVKPLAHVYTTHLQPDHTEEFAKIRAQQLQQVVDKIQADYASQPNLKIPYFLGGDLNIPWGSDEPGTAIMRDHFYDAYNHGRHEAGADATWTDFFTQRYYDAHHIPLHVDTAPGIIDYALLAKLPSYHEQDIHTVLIPIYSLQQPEISLSDHNGLMTTIGERAIGMQKAE